MVLLAIETSCDETAAAVVRDGRLVLSSVVSSQVAVHAEYGGVVPEIASRKHLEMITPVVRQALDEAGVALAAIEGIAVTRGPGLLGALLVGVSMAKSLALACKIPLVGVHHIEGHLLAGFLEQPVAFPFLALVVSGGHTHLYRVDGIGRYRILGRTIDDAVGEAFDKTATLLGLGYPGGAVIDRLAQQGSPSAVKLPRPLLHDGSLNFSFSGLKTAVLTHLKKQPRLPEGAELHDLCASFQAAVCEVLVKKTEAALKQEGLQRLVVGGGVACNSGLRQTMQQLATRRGIELQIPPPVLCGDNAAMLAVAGDAYLSAGCQDSLALDAVATWPLDQVARWEQLP
ncbi:tRNA (adenosine(37)-N6)-threonylcarbamoyltransferase complex transferase subunit TsaD [Trichlorobacter lovleyi]|uniref:tRNA (adenosine(37)-N6)-threonylcarbamoyltransferase complex transferase subunit TsaD n=1 Tax=Trichlorobacter lovleyi TaxID=313985 RepID=UPI00223E9F5F|nr:tRNA (adenosine(37)-N6)-threonylcarbamoyltransferase complex transferase subunit TsaD [Trichlorobacter lovleyi]QOX79347.1 tRNA (adenosine(37)-N6)-threonylcarbamoyltransferase complex transferase subunit TsaD [Trichlorobacter lovleyi]